MTEPVDPNQFDEEVTVRYQVIPPLIEPHPKGEPGIEEMIDEAVAKRKESGEKYKARHRQENA